MRRELLPSLLYRWAPETRGDWVSLLQSHDSMENAYTQCDTRKAFRTGTGFSDRCCFCSASLDPTFLCEGASLMDVVHPSFSYLVFIESLWYARHCARHWVKKNWQKGKLGLNVICHLHTSGFNVRTCTHWWNIDVLPDGLKESQTPLAEKKVKTIKERNVLGQ